ncbi:hypothetical protein [Roseobacter ponti]|uniref:Uncharacterized protein n=1 Tax=Roseobacter ponti TaxID=1891787 RepID=A0A858SN65_9RHOB|nr:hypothetical protein [Roseobacter ponti]QJF50254.1 hypothetical protein G3256_03260 [Roseobacter ponti]
MGKALIGIVCLVLGLVLGTVFGGAVVGGSAAGIGIATGLGAGICSTVRAAQEEGIMTAEQVDQVLNRAAADLAAASGADAPESVVGSAGECDAVLERLRTAAQES